MLGVGRKEALGSQQHCYKSQVDIKPTAAQCKPHDELEYRTLVHVYTSVNCKKSTYELLLRAAQMATVNYGRLGRILNWKAPCVVYWENGILIEGGNNSI